MLDEYCRSRRTYGPCPSHIGWRRYAYSTNHKDIGTMYLVFALTAGIIDGILSLAMRMELQEPGRRLELRLEHRLPHLCVRPADLLYQHCARLPPQGTGRR
jgi:hypothetical protein